MTDVMSDPMLRQATEPYRRVKSEGNTRVLRILAIVNGTEATGRVMKFLLELQTRGTIEVVLLNIQPKPQEWRTRGYGWFQREAIYDRLINDLGKKAIASAGRSLAGAGVSYKSRIELGEEVDTIVKCASEEECDLIVLAVNAPGWLRRRVMENMGLVTDSAASVLVHLSPVSVVVAK